MKNKLAAMSQAYFSYARLTRDILDVIVLQDIVSFLLDVTGTFLHFTTSLASFAFRLCLCITSYPTSFFLYFTGNLVGFPFQRVFLTLCAEVFVIIVCHVCISPLSELQNSLFFCMAFILSLEGEKMPSTSISTPEW